MIRLLVSEKANCGGTDADNARNYESATLINRRSVRGPM